MTRKVLNLLPKQFSGFCFTGQQCKFFVFITLWVKFLIFLFTHCFLHNTGWCRLHSLMYVICSFFRYWYWFFNSTISYRNPAKLKNIYSEIVKYKLQYGGVNISFYTGKIMHEIISANVFSFFLFLQWSLLYLFQNKEHSSNEIFRYRMFYLLHVSLIQNFNTRTCLWYAAHPHFFSFHIFLFSSSFTWCTLFIWINHVQLSLKILKKVFLSAYSKLSWSRW